MFQATTTTIFKLIRAATVIGGLMLAACAPMQLPGENAALQPASLSSAGTAEPSHTPGATTTGTAQTEVEFTGTLTAKDGSAWVVNGIRVTLTAQTEIKGNPQIGDTVKVEGRRQADGGAGVLVIAREIEVVLAASTATPAPSGTANPNPTASATPLPTSTVIITPSAEIEFTGVVTAMSGNQWTVSGFRVLVSAQTEIKGNPQVGSTVKVEGRLQADGSVLAREIKTQLPVGVTPAPVVGNEVEFRGTLTAINGNAYIVNGITVLITANTEVKDALQVGDFVKVHGAAQVDGTVIAREIEKDDDRSGHGGGEEDDDHSNPGNGDDEDDDDDHGGDDDDSGGGHP